MMDWQIKENKKIFIHNQTNIINHALTNMDRRLETELHLWEHLIVNNEKFQGKKYSFFSEGSDVGTVGDQALYNSPRERTNYSMN
jgi:hypothetical protein